MKRPKPERTVAVCLSCRHEYSQFYLRCPFCSSDHRTFEPEWFVRLVGTAGVA